MPRRAARIPVPACPSPQRHDWIFANATGNGWRMYVVASISRRRAVLLDTAALERITVPRDKLDAMPRERHDASPRRLLDRAALYERLGLTGRAIATARRIAERLEARAA